MFNFLHTFYPSAILFSFGPINIYWYGLFVVSGILAALFISFRLAKYYKMNTETLFDLSFWLIINGLIGARVYDVFLQLPYYLKQPLAIIKIWQGGLAIHGAIIAGLITIFFFARKNKLSFWRFLALITPGLALGQAIGRWGNYFNQELFGLPTKSSWGIPIELINRPPAYLDNIFFQPTFLYESLGCFLIFVFLVIINLYLIKREKLNNYSFISLSALYMILYSILRFGLEFIRIDTTPTILNLRWPQIISLALIIISIILLIFNVHVQQKKNSKK